ncbi:MAG TPA: hypothetical protein VLT81_14135, partial [Chondromyces sp.]|nr:hypothetical protein [Chondromyces sp.]
AVVEELRVGASDDDLHGCLTSRSRFVTVFAVAYLVTSTSDNEAKRTVAPGKAPLKAKQHHSPRTTHLQMPALASGLNHCGPARRSSSVLASALCTKGQHRHTDFNVTLDNVTVGCHIVK